MCQVACSTANDAAERGVRLPRRARELETLRHGRSLMFSVARTDSVTPTMAVPRRRPPMRWLDLDSASSLHPACAATGPSRRSRPRLSNRPTNVRSIAAFCVGGCAQCPSPSAPRGRQPPRGRPSAALRERVVQRWSLRPWIRFGERHRVGISANGDTTTTARLRLLPENPALVAARRHRRAGRLPVS